MRLSQSDRRNLDLILRKRLALARKLLLLNPLVIAVTMSIWLSPQAFADVSRNATHIHLEKTFVLEKEDDTVKSYSREDLSKQNPKAASSVGDLFSDEIIGVIQSVGASQRSVSKIQKYRSSAQSTKDYFDRASVGVAYSEHDSEANPDAIRAQLSKESANVIARENFENTELWQRLKKGLDFKLDFTKLFTRNSKKAKPASSAGKVRYGLILKDIKPDHSIGRARAAVGATTMADEMQYAGKAEVEWTIGPLTDDHRPKSVFGDQKNNGNAMTDEDIEALKEYQAELHEDGSLDDPLEIEKEADTDATVWQRGIKPSFGGNLRPAGKDAGEKIAAHQQPGLQITLTQEQGLYEYMTQTAGAGTAQKSEHRFKVPVVGTFAIGRRYNDKMEVISTSAHNVLISKRLPSLSVHFYEQTQQVVADARHDGENYSVTAKVRADAENVTEKQKKQRAYQRGYELGVSKRF